MTYLARIFMIFLGALLITLTGCNSNEPYRFQQLIPVKYDTLNIDSNKDTLIFGKKGIALFFEKGSFQLPDGGKPTGKISVVLKECFSNTDIIGEDLSTTANGNLLETRGMINVKVLARGQELQLKKGKNSSSIFHGTHQSAISR